MSPKEKELSIVFTTWFLMELHMCNFSLMAITCLMLEDEPGQFYNCLLLCVNIYMYQYILLDLNY